VVDIWILTDFIHYYCLFNEGTDNTRTFCGYSTRFLCWKFGWNKQKYWSVLFVVVYTNIRSTDFHWKVISQIQQVVLFKDRLGYTGRMNLEFHSNQIEYPWTFDYKSNTYEYVVASNSVKILYVFFITTVSLRVTCWFKKYLKITNMRICVLHICSDILLWHLFFFLHVMSISIWIIWLPTW